ncbi:MAG TPA: tripartite tricarboxylate transporter TctB family protein [Anaeromyxobacter sp.]|nr:tripartite tricarboxylate transporter TctB family protein [Anaeromyxobacter sp.]
MRRARVLGGLAALALGVAVIVLSRRLPYDSDYGPGPGFLPTWIGWVLSACAAVVTVQELRAPAAGELLAPRTALAVKVLVAIALTLLLVPALGFAAAFGLFSAVTMRITGRHAWVACACAAAAVTVGLHYVFGRWLSVPLPTGLLGW